MAVARIVVIKAAPQILGKFVVGAFQPAQRSTTAKWLLRHQIHAFDNMLVLYLHLIKESLCIGNKTVPIILGCQHLGGDGGTVPDTRAPHTTWLQRQIHK